MHRGGIAAGALPRPEMTQGGWKQQAAPKGGVRCHVTA